MAQSPKCFHMRVCNAGVAQCFRQRVAIELWIMPGAWDRSHVHHALDTVSLEHRDERLNGSSRMPNGEDQRTFSYCKVSFHLLRTRRTPS